MPIRVDSPSWFSALQADDKPVYLNREGAIRTGKSLKGRLVGIAESLGIFKHYVAAYRGREVACNRDAYDATWRFVNLKYGAATRHHTQESMEDKGYARAFSSVYVRRLRGCNVRDPHRAIVGRELRLILDTARGVDQTLQGEENDVAQQQYYTGSVVRSDAEIAAQKQRWAAWTGHRQSDAEAAAQDGTKVMKTGAVPETPSNADGAAGNLRDTEMSTGDLAEVAEARNRAVAEANTQESQIDEIGSKPVQLPSELGRAMVAGNKALLRRVLGGETQLRELAQELGYNPEIIASRRNYIQGKLEKRLETDSRARSGKLTPDEMRGLVRSVFDKALEKSAMVASIRGAMLSATSKVKRALDEDNPGQVDVLELSKDKIKAAAHDREYLKKLMVERFDTQIQEISAARMGYIEQHAIKEATVRVQETKVELSATEVDDVLANSLHRSFEIGESKAWLKGVFSKAAHTVKPQLYGHKRSTEDVIEKADDEQPRAPLETTDERTKALREGQTTLYSPGKESVTAPPQQDSSEPAAVAVPSPASLLPISLPKPRKYQGVDYFDRSDRGISRLGIPVRNHQAAKQVVTDNRYLVASVPEDYSGKELSLAHHAYIKTTLLRHVAEHERTSPGILLDAKDLHTMMMPITARALEMQNDTKLRAKVLYKNVAKHLGRKDAAFGDGLKKLRREARIEAASKTGLLSFVQGAAHKANIDIMIDHRVIRSIRPQVKDMAETYVDEHRKALTTPDMEYIVQAALRGYSLAERMGLVS